MRKSGACCVLLLLLSLAGTGVAQEATAASPESSSVSAEDGGVSSSPSIMSAPRVASPPSVRDYQPIRGTERVQWYLRNTAGAAVGGSVISAGWATAWGTPREYPATWEGFGKRYALSLSGVAIANGAEAGLGALWGEDPRYFRKGGNFRDDFGTRVNHVLLSTVTATNREGKPMPAYARFVAIPGSSFLQNEWRPESQASTGEALLRTLYGFLGRMSANAIREFLPDLRRRRPVPGTADPASPPVTGVAIP